MSENTDLLQRFEDEFVAGNIDHVLSILDDDIVVHECSHVPYPGDHRGKDGFLRLAEAFNSCWDIQSDLDLEIMPAGEDRVLVMVRFDAIAKHTGHPIHLRIAELYTIRDGKLADIVVHYWDTAEIVEVTGGVVVLEGEAV
jgi:ketosteroid isomerase-like protein